MVSRTRDVDVPIRTSLPVDDAAPATPAEPRLRLDPTLSHRALLDGAWWPRTNDLLAELPALVIALDGRRGRITHLMLGATWSEAHPRSLNLAGRRVRLGWFTSQPAGLLTAICANGSRVDLLVVPAVTPKAVADRVMTDAAEATNTVHAQDLLAVSTAGAPEATAEEVWDSEGGPVRRR
ncbi:MAG: DUF5994 family protein [Actinocatenispora sp.]